MDWSSTHGSFVGLAYGLSALTLLASVIVTLRHKKRLAEALAKISTATDQ